MDRSNSRHTALHYLEEKSPVTTNILLFLTAAFLWGIGISAAISSNSSVLIPLISIVSLAWYAFFTFSDNPKIVRFSGIISRVFLIAFLAYLLSTYYILENVESGSLFIYPFVLIAFLSVPSREAVAWSFIGFILLIIGSSVTGTESDFSFWSTLSFFLSLMSQIVVTYLVSEAARSSSVAVSAQQENIVKSNARYEVLFDSINDGLIVTDASGIIEFINNKGVNMLGLESKKLLGLPVSSTVLLEAMSGMTVDYGSYPVTKALTDHKTYSYNVLSQDRFSVIRADGSKFPAAITASPVVIDGVVTGGLFLFSDNTEIERMDRAKTEFVSLASHQLRTPLNVIGWYTEKLVSEKKGKLNEHQSRYLTEISSSSARMIKLVNELLSVSRAELGKIRVANENVDTREIFASIIEEMRTSIEQKHQELNIAQKDLANPVLMNSDAGLVRICVQNLFTNAVKYTPEGGTIGASMSNIEAGAALPGNSAPAPTAGVVFRVTDTGVGIPASQQEKIFEKLYRAENVQAMNVDGTGLGLYLSRQFILAMGGEIWFQSVQDKGSDFYIFLPQEREVGSA